MKQRALLFILLLLLTISSYVSANSDIPSCVIGSTCETGEFGLTEDEIAAYPAPNVEQIYPKDSLLYDRMYRRVNGAVDIYDAPNGNVKSTLGSGFNFVTVETMQEGWAQVAEGQWMRTDALTEDVMISRFAGVFLPEEALPYPMAWLLVHLRPAEYPGGEPSNDNELLLRYTTVNLYSTVEVDGWQWYQIGVNKWVKQTQVARILPVERPEDADTERWISIDLYEQVLVAYEGEKAVFATLVSSGMEQWSTNEGLFHVYVRYPRTPMSGAEGQEDFYFLQEVPWTMYFDEDIAVHGAYWHDGFGYRRSHGCVNMSITDAHWLYNWASPEFDYTVSNDEGPAVYVYSSGSYK